MGEDRLEDRVEDQAEVAEIVLKILGRARRPLPAAQLAAKLHLPMPRLLGLLKGLINSGVVVALHSASRVGYALRFNGEQASDATGTEAEQGSSATRSNSASLDNTRKRLF